MKWSGTFLIWPRKSVGNPRNACYAQSTLWEELLTLTHQSTCRDSKGKVQRHFFGASRGSRWGQNRQLIWWLLSELYLGYRGNIWRLLSTIESRIRDRSIFGLCRGLEDARAWKIAWTWIRSQFSLLQISPATDEMCSFQDRSDATETPNMDRHSHIFRVFELKRISWTFLFLLLEIKYHRFLLALKLTKFWEPCLFSSSRSRLIEDATLFRLLGREGLPCRVLSPA